MWPRCTCSARRHGHVVAQVVEAELVVGAVGDVGRRTARACASRVVVAGDDRARPSRPRHRWSWPIHSASRRGQVVVDRDEVHALAGERVEVDGQGGHEGLALAGLHLGDPAEVQGGAAHQLDVVVALAEHAAGGLADDGEGLDQQVVEVRAVGRAARGTRRVLACERVVGEGLHLGLERVDVGHEGLEGLDLLAFAGAEDLVEDAHGNVESTDAPRGPVSGRGPGREQSAPRTPSSAPAAADRVAPVVHTSSTTSTGPARRDRRPRTGGQAALARRCGPSGGARAGGAGDAGRAGRGGGPPTRASSSAWSNPRRPGPLGVVGAQVDRHRRRAGASDASAGRQARRARPVALRYFTAVTTRPGGVVVADERHQRVERRRAGRAPAAAAARPTHEAHGERPRAPHTAHRAGSSAAIDMRHAATL